MPTVKSKDRETLFDIAVVQNGGMESAFEMALQNDLSLTQVLKSGTVIALPAVANADVAASLQAQGARPASSISSEVITLHGIDYDIIETDLIVT